MMNKSYPTVTQVLKPWTSYGNVSPGVLEEASRRGAEVHKYCAMYAQCLPLEELVAEYRGYCQSFVKWFDATVDRVIAVEEEYVNSAIGFVGHPDLVCTLKGDDRLVVVDLKTGRASQPSWSLQVATYVRLAGADRGLIVRLSPNGDMPIVDEIEELTFCYYVFLNALTVYRFYMGM